MQIRWKIKFCNYHRLFIIKSFRRVSSIWFSAIKENLSNIWHDVGHGCCMQMCVQSKWKTINLFTLTLETNHSVLCSKQVKSTILYRELNRMLWNVTCLLFLFAFPQPCQSEKFRLRRSETSVYECLMRMSHTRCKHSKLWESVSNEENVTNAK